MSSDTEPRALLRERVRATLARISQTGALPALPAAASAALGIARDADADGAKLCRIIRTDIGLAARVIRVANSAAIGRRVPARKLEEAITTIGLRRTCDVLVAASARRMYDVQVPQAESLWNHALAVAVAAEELGRLTRLVERGGAFLPGLFHDIGRTAFLVCEGAAPDLVDAYATSEHADKLVLERDRYGCDHAEAGAVLAEDWGLALELCDAIRWHHAPAEAGAARDLATILNGADSLAYTIGCGFGGGRPSGVSLEPLGISADDEAACAERVHAAWLEQRDLLS